MKGRARTIAVGAVVASMTVAIALPGGSSAARSARKVFTGSVSGYASPSAAVGRAHGSVPIAVALRWRHAGQLSRFVNAVTDPRSPSYGHYLPADQFRSSYSPSPAKVASVESFLRSHGFRVTGVSKSGALVDAVGSVRHAESAFGTKLVRYRVGNQVLRGTAKAVSLPRPFARGVVGVVGLDQTRMKPLSRRSAPPPPAFRNAPPCSKYWGQKFASSALPQAYGQAQPFAPCGYDATQLQQAYGVDKQIENGIDGTGQTVAIIDAFAAPTIVADVNKYSSLHGLPPASIMQTVLTGTCQFGCNTANKQGWYGEETLDLEAVHAMAPRASIEYYGAVDSGGKSLLDALQMVVDNNTAAAVTNSYGSLGEQLTQPSIQAQEQVAEQAQAEGIGVYFSSGDNGDEKAAIGFRSADYPASSRRVTAVGGTSLGVGPLGGRTFEVGWGTYKSTLAGAPGSPGAHWTPNPPGDFLYGSGGGTSRLFAQPLYQHGVVPSNLVRQYGGRNRVLPDISMDGDPTTGMLVGETQTFPSGAAKYSEYRIGGTSLSSPLFAGYMALANQVANRRMGFVNPALYDLAGTNAIRDITPSHKQLAAIRNDYNNGSTAADGTTFSLRSLDLDSSLKTAKGYDNVTGLGSPPRSGALIDALAACCN